MNSIQRSNKNSTMNSSRPVTATSYQPPKYGKQKQRPSTATAFMTRQSMYSTLITQSHQPSPIWDFNPFIYRLNETINENSATLIQEVCNERGWKKYGTDEEQVVGGSGSSWNLWWRFTPTPIQPDKSLHSWQFTNHIPKAIGFANKEYLATYLKQMKVSYGSIYDFLPKTFILPADYDALIQEHVARTQLEFSNHENPAEPAQNLIAIPKTGRDSAIAKGDSINGNFNPIWIIKPVGKSQGKGITVVNDVESFEIMKLSAEFDENNNRNKNNIGVGHLSNVVVQEYICRPLLIGGFKFDLRLYVAIPCVSPLTVYIYREGLTRFATEEYNIDELTNSFSHLTNASLNKTGPNYSKNKERVGTGCKWNLSQLRDYLKEIEEPDWYLWQRIVSIINCSLIGESNKWITLPYTRNCFALLGYDILIDEHLRPWLLEVNLCPGLNADCDLDYAIKKPMLNELFNLVGLPNDGAKKPPNNGRTKQLSPYEQYYLQQTKAYGPPKYMPTPLAYINPTTIIKAMELVQPKYRDKVESRPTLINRLADMTSIYSKKLVPTSAMKGKGFKGKRPTTAPTTTAAGAKAKQDSFALKNTTKATIKKKGILVNAKKTTTKQGEELKPNNGLVYRSWTDPVAESGDWVRAFPFDQTSHELSRGQYSHLDTKAITLHIESQLTNARLLAFKFRDDPNVSDKKYNDALKKINKLTSEVWLPRRSFKPQVSKHAKKGGEPETSCTTEAATVMDSSLQDQGDNASVVPVSTSTTTICTIDSATSSTMFTLDLNVEDTPKTLQFLEEREESVNIHGESHAIAPVSDTEEFSTISDPLKPELVSETEEANNVAQNDSNTPDSEAFPLSVCDDDSGPVISATPRCGDDTTYPSPRSIDQSTMLLDAPTPDSVEQSFIANEKEIDCTPLEALINSCLDISSSGSECDAMLEDPEINQNIGTYVDSIIMLESLNNLPSSAADLPKQIKTSDTNNVQQTYSCPSSPRRKFASLSDETDSEDSKAKPMKLTKTTNYLIQSCPSTPRISNFKTTFVQMQLYDAVIDDIQLVTPSEPIENHEQNIDDINNNNEVEEKIEDLLADSPRHDPTASISETP